MVIDNYPKGVLCPVDGPQLDAMCVNYETWLKLKDADDYNTRCSALGYLKTY